MRANWLLMALVFFAMGMALLISARHPEHDVRWGRSRSTPMSPRGRRALAAYSAGLGVVVLVGGNWPALWTPLCLIVGIGGLVVIYSVYRQDRNRHDTRPPAP